MTSDCDVTEKLALTETPPPTTHFFEGAEKLLEVWFTGGNHATSLRQIPRFEIDALLDIAGCRILSKGENKFIDSYVLSESSLFISDRRVILKTCGSTRLLAALEPLLLLAEKYCDLTQVRTFTLPTNDLKVVNVYYSRKNFLRPELQPTPHQSFDHEIDVLDQFFEDGAAYCMGSLKKDRWYLYTLNSCPEDVEPYADHTLEIIMTEMPEEVLKVYSRDMCEDGKECTRKAGIDKILPRGTIIHEELFDPCGYSMNGLSPDSDEYVTIHVTPEPDFSYVSFETNQKAMCLYKQTMKVLELFRPQKVLMTVFSNEHSLRAKDAQQQLWERDLPGYKRSNLQFIRLKNETLVYAHFDRKRVRGVSLRVSSDSEDGDRSD